MNQPRGCAAILLIDALLWLALVVVVVLLMELRP